MSKGVIQDLGRGSTWCRCSHCRGGRLVAQGASSILDVVTDDNANDNSDDDKDDDDDEETNPSFFTSRPCGIDSFVGVLQPRLCVNQTVMISNSTIRTLFLCLSRH